MAQAPAGAVFTAVRGQLFGLVFDGEPMTQGLVREAYAQELAPGEHAVEFTIPGNSGATRLQTKLWLEPAMVSKFELMLPNNAPPYLRMSGSVAAGLANMSFGSSKKTLGGYSTSASSGPNNYPPANHRLTPPPPAGTAARSTSNGRRLMQPQDVEALLQTVKARSFEATRLSTAKEALRQTSIRAEDLKRLLKAMGFESSRVELAKFAYPHVADPQNFFHVYDAFDFEASVKDVQQAVAATEHK